MRLEMNLLNYLRTRHRSVNALTRPEAVIIGLDYPLVRGWVDKYGSLEIPDEIVTKLKSARKERYAKVASNKAKTFKKLQAKKKLISGVLTQSKSQKKKQSNEVERMVKNIIADGCSNQERMLAHLNKPSK